jgi:hypothetical protein
VNEAQDRGGALVSGQVFSCESLSENYEECCFRGKGRMARRDEGEYPWWIFD